MSPDSLPGLLVIQTEATDLRSAQNESRDSSGGAGLRRTSLFHSVPVGRHLKDEFRPHPEPLAWNQETTPSNGGGDVR
ncbi:hypothetical protein EYF80_058207 [Liparis tanakae]|uniref:Uncharacterized protein n=1 Tax=Liparis tanakae TaxID=230148 RepID=A0A4Z2ERU0_9TELE|nr:hypothetical protein EYF80_058207 [Liparis tanakae]